MSGRARRSTSNQVNTFNEANKVTRATWHSHKPLQWRATRSKRRIFTSTPSITFG